MCNPLALGIVMAAGAAAQSYSQYSAGKAQASYLKEQYEAQQDQLDAQASAEANEAARKARRERARIAVAAGEAGVSGNSFEAQLHNSLFQQQNQLALVNYNQTQAKAASQDQLNSALSGIQMPTALGAALQIGTAFASGYAVGGEIGAGASGAA